MTRSSLWAGITILTEASIGLGNERPSRIVGLVRAIMPSRYAIPSQRHSEHTTVTPKNHEVITNTGINRYFTPLSSKQHCSKRRTIRNFSFQETHCGLSTEMPSSNLHYQASFLWKMLHMGHCRPSSQPWLQHYFMTSDIPFFHIYQKP